MVRRSHPDRDPVETVLRWLGDLQSSMRLTPGWARYPAGREGGAARILDVAFDEQSIPVARHLLAGATDAAVAESLRETHRPEMVFAKCAEFHKSVLLQPLFGT